MPGHLLTRRSVHIPRLTGVQKAGVYTQLAVQVYTMISRYIDTHRGVHIAPLSGPHMRRTSRLPFVLTLHLHRLTRPLYLAKGQEGRIRKKKRKLATKRGGRKIKMMLKKMMIIMMMRMKVERGWNARMMWRERK